MPKTIQQKIDKLKDSNALYWQILGDVEELKDVEKIKTDTAILILILRELRILNGNRGDSNA